ncbi:S1 family peptidase [Saccharothrix obliqua]|uniref:S1 family peptidase n=1 Tax=Saccharothrix obliqua TaxID=2861747 RepID=UPI001C5D96D4|nr:S1 family peptidase [Saccharothrix obliqua]MBW4715816.1 S1 family peptidase [Saccharothrix obliqua]
MAGDGRAVVRPIKRLVEDDFLGRPGVVGVDIGEKVVGGRGTGVPAIVVYVRRKRSAARFTIPPDVLGVPTDVVEDTFLPHHTLASPEGVSGAERHELLLGGIGVGPSRAVRLVPPDVPAVDDYLVAGTLGAFVTPRGKRRTMALTAFHIACVDDAWAVGDPMVHPSRVDGGHPYRDRIGVLARAALSGTVDAAAILLTTPRTRPEVVGLGTVAGPGKARVGQHVRKRGRTTALTEGVVASTDAAITLDFGVGLGVRTLRDQIRVEGPFGYHGDSGAVLLDDANHVVGLYCGGSRSRAFANPIANVLDQLDVDLLPVEP